MGTVLSNSSSVAHTQTKRQQCYWNDRASLTDLPSQSYQKPVFDSRYSNDNSVTAMLDIYSHSVSHNGCTGNSVNPSRQPIFEPPSTMLSHSDERGGSGLRRVTLPSFSRKTKGAGSTLTIFRKSDPNGKNIFQAAPQIQTRNVSYVPPTKQGNLDANSTLNVSQLHEQHQDKTRLQVCPEEGTELNTTPYSRPHDSLEPICTACKHFSISCYQQSPIASNQYTEVNTVPQLQYQAPGQQPSRHVHFNPRRQFSEPNNLRQRPHSHCILHSERTSHTSVMMSSSPQPSLCRCERILPIKGQPVRTSSDRLPQLQRCSSSHSKSKIFHASAAHRRSPSEGNESYDNFIPATNLLPQCAPHFHRDSKHRSCTQLSINAVSPSRFVGSPHPNVAHRVHSSVQPSPAYNRLSTTSEELRAVTGKFRDSPYIRRRNTTITESAQAPQIQDPTKVRRESSWGKNLTKSLSCYALRFFSQHHYTGHFRSRTATKNDSSSQHSIASKAEKNNRRGSGKPPDRKQSTCIVEADQAQEDKVVESTHPIMCQNTPWFDKRQPTYLQDQVFQTCSLVHPQEQVHSNTAHRSYYDPPKLYLPEDTGHALQTTSDRHCNIKYDSDLARFWMRKEDRFSHCRMHLIDPRQTVFKASTSELLRCLSLFVIARIQLIGINSSTSRTRSNRLRLLQPSVIINWIRAIDRALLVQGWSELAFMNPANVVFLFMMLKDCLNFAISSERELHTIIMACLYLSYSYMGNEISYPLKPFLIAETNQMLAETSGGNRKSPDGENALLSGFDSSIRTKVIDQVRSRFWQYCLRIINSKSADMLRINADSLRFTQLFTELKSYDSLMAPFNMPLRISSTPK